MEEAIEHLANNPEDTAWLNNFLNNRRKIYFSDQLRRFAGVTGYVKEVVDQLRQWMEKEEYSVKVVFEARSFADPDIRSLKVKRLINLLHYDFNNHIAKSLITDLNMISKSPLIGSQRLKDGIGTMMSQLVGQLNKYSPIVLAKVQEVIDYHINYCANIDAIDRYDSESIAQVREIEARVAELEQRRIELVKSIIERRLQLTLNMNVSSGPVFSHVPDFD